MYIYKNFKIGSIYSCFPSNKRVISEFYSNIFDQDKINKFSKTVGINELRISKKSTTSLSLALKAAKQLIIDLHLEIDEIGTLIFVTQTPDYLLPGNSFIIQKELGLSSSCNVFDINLGCSGFVHGLNTLLSLMSQNDKKYGLLLTSDTITKIIDVSDSATSMLFGDAGNATLVEKTNISNNIEISIESIGEKFENIITTKGLFKNPGEKLLFMNGIEVFNFSLSDVKNSINNHLLFTSHSFPNYDYFVPHQANLFMLKQLSKSLKFLSNTTTLYSLEKFGNTSVASIPLTLTSNLVDYSNKNILISGFGVGLSIATASLNINNLITKNIEFEEVT
jgi:3-oxoacyl-[acyl-carrier-protein] synthase-3